MEAKQNEVQKTYSYELKLKAIKLYFDGFTRTEIAEECNITNKKMVNHWVNKYKQGGPNALKDKRGLKRGMDKGRKRKITLTLEEENERLKAENLYLKKLIDQKRGCYLHKNNSSL
jgi:transposase